MNKLKAAIKEMRERCEAALRGGSAHAVDRANRAFVSSAYTDIPKLLAALEVTLEALEEIGLPVQLDDSILNRPLENMSLANNAVHKATELLSAVSPLSERKKEER